MATGKNNDLPPSHKVGTFTNDIDVVSRQSGLGAISEATTNALFGINHRGVGNPVAYNTDNQGLTFFTRPRLNLSYDNIAMDRRLTPLLTTAEYTYQRAIRALLDPVGCVGRNVNSPLVDAKSPFIALLTNNLLSLNGWPDPVADFYTSKEGPARESWSMIDGFSRQYGTFELQASFRNIAGDPITLLFNAWTTYALLVYEGALMPYPDSVVENEIDYMTRIYRLVLDPSRRFVTKIAATGASFPVSPALGQAFNFSSDTPFNQENAQQISIPFQCIGAQYQDPILIKEFNDVVCFFNNDMYDDFRGKRMVKLPPEDLNVFNGYGYPRIHPYSQELEWYVPVNQYRDLKNGMKLSVPKPIPYTPAPADSQPPTPPVP